jgi:hypothetical protein
LRSAEIAGYIVVLESLTIQNLDTLKRVSVLAAKVSVCEELNRLGRELDVVRFPLPVVKLTDLLTLVKEEST